MTDATALVVSQQTLLYLIPEIFLIAAATVMITAAAFRKRPRAHWSTAATLAILATALAVVATQAAIAPGHPDPYKSVISHDALSLFARLGILFTSLILLALGHDQVDDARAAEFFGSILFITAGAMISVSANEIILLFLGLELVSIPTYLLLYLPRRGDESQEATIKYFYLSIFSSALLLFGLAYLYGLTGITNLRSLQYLVHWNNAALRLPHPMFGVIALVFIMSGFGFRIAAVPFHFYAPDVYQGASTVISALLAWIPKVIGMVAMLRVLAAVFGWEPFPQLAGKQVIIAGEVSNLVQISDKAVVLCWILAAITLTLGNTVALAQTNLKRLLAYSSISHAGYLLVGMAAAFRNAAGGTQAVLAADAILFYLAVYALMTLGAFGVIILLHTPEKPVEKIDDLSGLWRTNRWAALAMVLCLFSLAGIPPLAGFWGKFRIFQAVLEAARGADTTTFLALTIVGVVNAAIGAYYYLRIIVIMIFRDPHHTIESRPAWPTSLAVTVCAGLSLWFGLFPGSLANATRAAGAAVIATPEPTSFGNEKIVAELGQ